MLSDWDSSLTELSSGEEEQPLRPPKKKKPTKAKAEYMVTNCLQLYRTTTYSAKSLYDQIVDNTIELDPDYQRDVVWTEAKQIGLVDSLLRNFYIPPIIFAVKRHEDGIETRTCIDGKQRLTSIQFETNKKYWFRACDDEKRALLSRQLIHAFSNKQITCIEYDELTDDQEREIFQRVQLGVALTTAERMQAIPGPWPALIREVQSMVLGDDGFGEDLDWGHDRGRDFACLASIIHLIDLHPTTIFPSVPRLEKWLSSTKPVPAKTREEVLETFRIFVALVRDKRYNRAFSRPARVSPIEFTMIGVLIYRFRKTHSLMQLSSAIWLLRADVRKKHADIRSNQKVTNTMFKFLTKELPNADLVGDGKGDIPASVAIKSYVEGSIGATTEKALSPAGEKRRRLQRTASSDSEGEPVPRKRPSLSGASSLPNGTTTASTSSTRAKATSSKKSISSTSAVASSKSAEKATMKAISRATKSTPASKTAPVRTASSASKSPATTTTNASQSTGRVTTRTTRTAAAAAADALALAQAIESSSADLQPFLSEQAVKKRSRISNRDRNEEPSQSATVDQLPTAPSIKDTEPTAAHARPDVITSNTESSAEVNGVQTSEGQTTVSPTRIIVANLDTQARRSVAQSTPVATTPTEKASQDSVEQLLVKHGQPESTTSRHTVESSSGPSQSSSMAPVQPAASNLRPPTSPLAMVPPPPPPPLFLASTAKNGATSIEMGDNAQRATPSNSVQDDRSTSSSRDDRYKDSDRDRHRGRSSSTWSRDGGGSRSRTPRRDRSESRVRSKRYDSKDRSRSISRSWSRGRVRDGRRSRSKTPERRRHRYRSPYYSRSRSRDRYEYRSSARYSGGDVDRARDRERHRPRGDGRDRYRYHGVDRYHEHRPYYDAPGRS
ncbi:hypothetical protein PYCCODRAFT_1390517 [Trametes coccinea BRFM310]|uniref:GmrSD restriction endonucleases N-terminal domain-containing protein n=1 Tax=Trametes coccinea (strain BRFM310) TaxID=1353009 RepID=A0A1Y2IML6_TRAC3|nr:hypothetical protein PYCCODRAFT_1390517 [Trametes coccinea BRFM310]